MGIIQIARRGIKQIGMKSLGGGYGQSGFGSFGNITLEDRNWNREAGVRFDNPIVYAGIEYIFNGFQEMKPYVRRRKGDGWMRVNNHPVEKLLHSCMLDGSQSPWYDGATLESGWIISETCGRGGMSYTYKHRSSGGRLIALEYIPHFAVMPFCSPGSGNFIDWYQVSVAGGYGAGHMPMRPGYDLLAMRHGPINPYRLVESYGPIEACLLEVVTDKQAAQFTASLITNVGITPHYFKPGWKDANGEPGSVTKEQWGEFLALYDDQITGPNRGKPFGATLPFDVEKLGFSPTEMDLGAIRNLPEERICSALRIHPNSLGLGTGLEQANNRASAGVAEKQSARNCLKPYASRRAQQLTTDFRAEGLLGDDEEVYYPAQENLEALQEDKNERSKRLTVACGGAYMSVNEARKIDGLEPTGNLEDDEVRSTSAAPEDDQDEDVDDGKVGVGATPKKPKPPKKGKDAK